MKRLVNVRAMVVLAFAIGCGAGFSYLSAYYSVPFLWLIAVIPVTAFALVFFIVKRNTAGIIVTAAAALLFLYGVFGVSLNLGSYNDARSFEGRECIVSGRVFEKSYTQGGEYLKLNNLVIDGEDIKGCMTVYLGADEATEADVGYTVSFTSAVYTYKPFEYGEVNSERLLQNIRYRAYPSEGVQAEYGFSLFGTINSAVRELYFDNLDEDTAAIVYAMYTGNVDYIETSTMDSFRYGGVAHVFAVSGMHIVLVYGVVSFILKKLRLGAVPVSVISVILVFFFTGMCGFTLSAVRAAIMCAVGALVRLVFSKYDGLSALGIAFTVIMLINPLNIISVGFQLSVAAVAGISLFSSKITRALKKIKIPSVIASATAMTLSSQIATFPIMLSCFGYVSWMSLVLNVVFVPLLSAIFTLQFVLTLFAFIIPPLAGAFLSVFAVPVEAVTAALVSIHAESALISGFSFGIFALPYFTAVYAISGHVNIKVPFRIIIATVLAAVIGAGIGLANYIPQNSLKITASAKGESYSVLLSSNSGDALVISEYPSSYDVNALLSANGAASPDAVIVLGGHESVIAYTRISAESSNLYVWQDNLNFQPYSGVTVHYEREFVAAGIQFEYIDGYNLEVNFGGTSVGICMGENVPFESCDMLFAATNVHACKCGKAVYFNRAGTERNLYDCGDLQITVKDGKITYNGNSSRKGLYI